MMVLKDILVSQESLYGKYLHRDVKVSDEEEGTFGIGTELNDTIIKQILEANINQLKFQLLIQLIKVLIY